MVPAKGDDGTEGYAPAVNTRFFTDDTAHGEAWYSGSPPHNLKRDTHPAPSLSRTMPSPPLNATRPLLLALGLCVLQGIAELLDVQVPRILFLIRRMQEMLGKKYVSELPDAHVCGQGDRTTCRTSRGPSFPPPARYSHLFSSARCAHASVSPGPLPQRPRCARDQRATGLQHPHAARVSVLSGMGPRFSRRRPQPLAGLGRQGRQHGRRYVVTRARQPRL